MSICMLHFSSLTCCPVSWGIDTQVAFNDMPRTESAAKADGWTNLLDCGERFSPEPFYHREQANLRLRQRRDILHNCLIQWTMVFRWGLSRSRASLFHLKIKTRGSKRVWNLDLLKTERLEIARMRRRGSEISLAPWLSHSRSLALALSHSRASRFLKPVNFRRVWGFHVKTSRFYFYKKVRLEIASGPIGTP